MTKLTADLNKRYVDWQSTRAFWFTIKFIYPKNTIYSEVKK